MCNVLGISKVLICIKYKVNMNNIQETQLIVQISLFLVNEGSFRITSKKSHNVLQGAGSCTTLPALQTKFTHCALSKQKHSHGSLT